MVVAGRRTPSQPTHPEPAYAPRSTGSVGRFGVRGLGLVVRLAALTLLALAGLLDDPGLVDAGLLGVTGVLPPLRLGEGRGGLARGGRRARGSGTERCTRGARGVATTLRAAAVPARSARGASAGVGLAPGALRLL